MGFFFTPGPLKKKAWKKVLRKLVAKKDDQS